MAIDVRTTYGYVFSRTADLSTRKAILSESTKNIRMLPLSKFAESGYSLPDGVPAPASVELKSSDGESLPVPPDTFVRYLSSAYDVYSRLQGEFRSSFSAAKTRYKSSFIKDDVLHDGWMFVYSDDPAKQMNISDNPVEFWMVVRGDAISASRVSMTAQPWVQFTFSVRGKDVCRRFFPFYSENGSAFMLVTEEAAWSGPTLSKRAVVKDPDENLVNLGVAQSGTRGITAVGGFPLYSGFIVQLGTDGRIDSSMLPAVYRVTEEWVLDTIASAIQTSEEQAAEIYLSKNDARATYVDKDTYGNDHEAIVASLSNLSSDVLTLFDNVSGVSDALSAHTNYTENPNPHHVTKAQVGLGNVDNTSDMDKPVSTATRAAIDEVSAKLSSVYRYKGSVDDYRDLPSYGNEPGDTYNVKSDGMNVAWVEGGSNDSNDGYWDDLGASLEGYLTEEKAAETYLTIANAINEYASKQAFENHIGDTDNPHQVTKAQVGLGNVDNTSDLNKPISTATQTALGGKADDNAVVKLTGDQTINGAKTFNDDVYIDGSVTRTLWIGNVSYDYNCAGFNQDRILRRINGGSQFEIYLPSAAGKIPLLQDIAANYSTSKRYYKNSLCTYDNVLYRCTTLSGTIGQWSPSSWAVSTVDDALSDKVDKVSPATANNFVAFLTADGAIKDSGKKASDFATAAQGGKADTALQPEDVVSTYSSSGTSPVNGTSVAAALGTLDAAVTSTDGTNVQVKVTETDGKVSAVNITTDDTASVADATLTEIAEFSEWIVRANGEVTTEAKVRFTTDPTGKTLYQFYPPSSPSTSLAEFYCPTDTQTSIVAQGSDSAPGVEFSATRTKLSYSYQLGSQDDKKLQPAGDYALKSEVPTKVSDLTNDVGYITSETEFNAWKTGASIAAGNGASAASNMSVAIGNRASASGQKAIAISSSDNANTTTASGTLSIAVGFYAKATANEAIAIGKQAQASAAGSVQIGYSANANDVANSLRFRDTVIVDGNGNLSETDPVFTAWKGANPVVLGAVDVGTAKPSGGVIVGSGAKIGNVNQSNAIAIGNAAYANNSSAIAIGSNITVSGLGSAQIGHSDTTLSTEKTFRFRDTVVVDSNGKIPSSNLDVNISSMISSAITTALQNLARNGIVVDNKLYTLNEQPLDNVQTLARAAGVQNISDNTTVGDIETALSLNDSNTVQDAVNAVS